MHGLWWFGGFWFPMFCRDLSCQILQIPIFLQMTAHINSKVFFSAKCFASLRDGLIPKWKMEMGSCAHNFLTNWIKVTTVNFINFFCWLKAAASLLLLSPPAAHLIFLLFLLTLTLINRAKMHMHESFTFDWMLAF